MRQRYVMLARLTVALGLLVTGPALARSVRAPSYRLVRSVALGRPDRWDYAVYDPGSHRVFVAHGNRLTVLDGRSGRIVGQVGPIPGGPHGIAFDTLTHRLFVSCENGRLVVVAVNDGTNIATVPIGQGTDADCFDARRRLIFSANGSDGTLSIIREVSPQKFLPVATVRTALSGRTMALDPLSGRVYVVAAHTTPQALHAFIAAWRSGRTPRRSPFTPDSLRAAGLRSAALRECGEAAGATVQRAHADRHCAQRAAIQRWCTSVYTCA